MTNKRDVHLISDVISLNERFCGPRFEFLPARRCAGAVLAMACVNLSIRLSVTIVEKHFCFLFFNKDRFLLFILDFLQYLYVIRTATAFYLLVLSNKADKAGFLCYVFVFTFITGPPTHIVGGPD